MQTLDMAWTLNFQTNFHNVHCMGQTIVVLVPIFFHGLLSLCNLFSKIVIAWCFMRCMVPRSTKWLLICIIRTLHPWLAWFWLRQINQSCILISFLWSNSCAWACFKTFARKICDQVNIYSIYGTQLLDVQEVVNAFGRW
jgi:hypothetical protein